MESDGWITPTAPNKRQKLSIGNTNTHGQGQGQKDVEVLEIVDFPTPQKSHDVSIPSTSSKYGSPGQSNKNVSQPQRPLCQYGIKCYRRNPGHLLEFLHPTVEQIYDGMTKTGNFSEIPSNLLPDFNKSGMERRVILDQIRILRDARLDLNAEPLPTSSTSSSNPQSSWNGSLSDIRDQRRKKFIDSKSQAQNVSEIAGRTSMQQKWEQSLPFNFFLTKVSAIHNEKDGVLSASFKDLFDPSLGEVKAVCHFNFMVDPEWFLQQTIGTQTEGKPTRIIFNGNSKDLEGVSEAFPWIKVFGVKSPFPYGHHHTKMTIVQYTDCSIRFIIYTANLIESDWENRTQGIWIGPRCPKLELNASTTSSGDSVTKFRSDIIEYLSTYPIQVTRAWIDVIRTVDCSGIKVYFVASAPVTAQSGSSGFQWGTCKMEKVLKSHNFETDPSWPLVIQCSSIGTLGQPQDWVQGELGSAFAGKDRVIKGDIHVVYPSHSNVSGSYEGLHGGGCLPYSASTHMKQTWLEKHLCQWKANRSGRSRAVPHIKSYFRISPDNTKLAWFLLTSANLSKAAWGKINKKGSLSVMSWEAGVLFVPHLLTSQPNFAIKTQEFQDQKEDILFPVPIDIPLVKYEKRDKPWFFDTLQALILQS